jgi:hypothetical protein
MTDSYQWLLLFAVVGLVFAAALAAAFLVWSIRSRRGEENFTPAPPRPLRPVTPMTASVRESPALRNEAPAPETNPSMKKVLRRFAPEIWQVVELSKRITAASSAAETPDEKKAAIHRALVEMVREQPDNVMLQQLIAQFDPGENGPEEEPVDEPSSGAEAAGLSATLEQLLGSEFRDDQHHPADELGFSNQGQIKVIRAAGRNLVSIDGVEYRSTEEIADLRLREQARRILALADKIRRSPD